MIVVKRIRTAGLAAAMLCLLLASFADAQPGNDFPFTPGLEPWGCCQWRPGIQPGYDYEMGTWWGPVSVGNKRGGTISVDLVMDWWSLGPLVISIVSEGTENGQMRLVSGRLINEAGHPELWAGFCITRCTFEWESPVANASVQIAWAGTTQFGAHLENIGSRGGDDTVRSPIDQWRKDQAAGRMAAAQEMLVANGAATVAFCLGPLSSSIFCTALKITNVVLAVHILRQQGIINDPFDPDFNSPWDVRWREPVYWTGNQTVNELIDAARWMSSMGDYVYNSANRATSCSMVGADCYDWQAARTMDGLRALGHWQKWAAGHLNILANELPYLDGHPGDDAWVFWGDTAVQDMAIDYDGMMTTLLMDCCPQFGGWVPAGARPIVDVLRLSASILWDQGVENES